MAFGLPTRYLQLDLNRVSSTANSNNVRTVWDKAVEQASDEYKKRMVNSFDLLLFFIDSFSFSTIYAVIIVIHTWPWHWIPWIMTESMPITWFHWHFGCFSVENMSGTLVEEYRTFHSFSCSVQFHWFPSFLAAISHSPGDYCHYYRRGQTSNMMPKRRNKDTNVSSLHFE